MGGSVHPDPTPLAAEAAAVPEQGIVHALALEDRGRFHKGHADNPARDVALDRALCRHMRLSGSGHRLLQLRAGAALCVAVPPAAGGKLANLRRVAVLPGVVRPAEANGSEVLLQLFM